MGDHGSRMQLLATDRRGYAQRSSSQLEHLPYLSEGGYQETARHTRNDLSLQANERLVK